MSHYFQHLDFYNNAVRLPEEYRNDPMGYLKEILPGLSFG